MTKLVPIVNDQTAPYFCKNFAGEPYLHQVMLDDGQCVNTGYLRVGKQVSLLGIAYDPALLAAGLIDNTDSVGDNVRVSAIAFGTPDGVVVGVVHVSDQLAAELKPSPESRRHKLQLNFDSKNVEWAHEDIKSVHVQLVGTLDLQTSILEVHAVNPRLPNSDLEVIGYMLQAERVNSNRRSR